MFIEAALELETDVQEDILTIFKSVLAPDTGEMTLTEDLENILMGTDSSPPISCFSLFEIENQRNCLICIIKWKVNIFFFIEHVSSKM